VTDVEPEVEPEPRAPITPPMARGGLYLDPNFVPRLSDRLGSVRTDTGVNPNWHRAIAPGVFFPHLPNPAAQAPTVAELPETHPVEASHAPAPELVPVPPLVAEPEVVVEAPQAPVEPPEALEGPTGPPVPFQPPTVAQAPPEAPVVPAAPARSSAEPEPSEWDLDQYWGIEPGAP
jgi:hypothetical protein